MAIPLACARRGRQGWIAGPRRCFREQYRPSPQALVQVPPPLLRATEYVRGECRFNLADRNWRGKWGCARGEVYLQKGDCRKVRMHMCYGAVRLQRCWSVAPPAAEWRTASSRRWAIWRTFPDVPERCAPFAPVTSSRGIERCSRPVGSRCPAPLLYLLFLYRSQLHNPSRHQAAP